MIEPERTIETKAYPRWSWATEGASGLVVGLVALPLCLGIALASGAPLISGLISGIIGGLIVSWMGGTHLLVSGPAAGLATIVLAAIDDLGSYDALLAALVVGGVLQAGFALLGAGKIAPRVPHTVVTGMLSAIGLLLLLQQISHAVGAVPPKGVHGIRLLGNPVHALQNMSLAPTLVGVASVLVLIAWDHPVAARWRRFLPGPLAAVLVGTLVGEALPLLGLALDAAHRVNLPDLTAGVGSLVTPPDWSALSRPLTWEIGITLAIVASLETLLSMEATDRMDPLKRTSNGDRELLAQGVGNTLSGLIGGLPMTGVIVRSAANVSAGGLTWRSAMLHGIFLSVAVFALPTVLEQIPLSALAGVLLFTGFKLLNPRNLIAAASQGKTHAGPLFATIAGVIATDLLIGVLIGLATAALAVPQPRPLHADPH